MRVGIMKRLLLFLAVIVFKNSETMSVGVVANTPKLNLVLGSCPAAIKTTSPRLVGASSSPRKSLKELQASGEKIVHPLLVRAQSERRLASLSQHKDEKEELKRINEADKHPTVVQVPRRNSGSSSPLRTSKTESENSEGTASDVRVLAVTSTNGRRNTIST